MMQESTAMVMQKNLIQQLWIDESGDSGFKFGKGSSNFLVLVAVYLIEVEEPDIVEKIARLRLDLRLTPEYEFKFSRCKHAVRETFLTAMAQLSILYKAMVINKRSINAPALKTQPQQLYAESVKRLLYDNDPPLAKATLIIDEATAKIHQKEFNRILKQYVSKNLVRKVRQLRSQSEDMIQVADMIAGSIFRSYEKNDDRYHLLIKSKEKILIEF